METDTFCGVTFAINVDTPEQVDSTIETIGLTGAQILQEPGDAFWVGEIAYFADPENNFWEMA
ncbi:VOC family protein [Paenibacillus doosanensis]|uniref:VOC family protein n=1 Tax=Paenibacillus doosanensis TaxID=1229154 RepID=UPI0021801CF9|nr:VOC family protein [Paenibacillus doosanensis]